MHFHQNCETFYFLNIKKSDCHRFYRDLLLFCWNLRMWNGISVSEKGEMEIFHCKFTEKENQVSLVRDTKLTKIINELKFRKKNWIYSKDFVKTILTWFSPKKKVFLIKKGRINFRNFLNFFRWILIFFSMCPSKNCLLINCSSFSPTTFNQFDLCWLK